MGEKRIVLLEEEIDRLRLTREQYHSIFRDLNFLNKWLGNDYLLMKSIKKIIGNSEFKPGQMIRIVDLGCGNAHHIQLISEYLKNRGLPYRLTGIDFNPKLIEEAQNIFNLDDGIEFMCTDIKHHSFKIPECDILISSQFAYRFTDTELLKFIENNIANIRLGIVFSELERIILLKPLFAFFGTIFLLHKTTISDGKKSIDRSWKRSELLNILLSSGVFHRISIIKLFFRNAILCRIK